MKHAVGLLPLQLLWLNLMTDGLLGLALGVEAPAKNVMRRPPHAPGASIWAGGLGRQAAWMGGLIGIGALAVGYIYEANDRAEWQTMVFTSLAFLQIFQAIGTRSTTESLRSIGVWSNKAMTGTVALVASLQLVAIYSPLRNFLDLEPLGAVDLAIAVGLGAAFLGVIEAAKSVARVRTANNFNNAESSRA